MNFQECMKEIRKKYATDSAMSKSLGISRQAIFHIRDGYNIPKDETVIKICNELKLNKDEMLIKAHIERTKGEARKIWEEIEKKLASVAASILVMATLPAILNGGQCILCKIVKVNHSTIFRNKLLKA